MSRLDEGPDLVVCGIHFDESRMFDILRLAKATEATRHIPFVCFRDMDSDLSEPILEGLRIACTALGATAFIDLRELKRRSGVVRADAGFRTILLDALAAAEAASGDGDGSEA